MVAAAALKRSGVDLGGRVLVGALVDEEGDMIGVKHLCASPLGRELAAAIICEPEQNELCLEQRGVVWARVTARGRMAHGAMPEAGVNPIAALVALLGEAPALERRLRRLCRGSSFFRLGPSAIVRRPNGPGDIGAGSEKRHGAGQRADRGGRGSAARTALASRPRRGAGPRAAAAHPGAQRADRRGDAG